MFWKRVRFSITLHIYQSWLATIRWQIFWVLLMHPTNYVPRSDVVENAGDIPVQSGLSSTKHSTASKLGLTGCQLSIPLTWLVDNHSWAVVRVHAEYNREREKMSNTRNICHQTIASQNWQKYRVIENFTRFQNIYLLLL